MTRLRLATWNIHGGVGLDRRFSPDRIARVIAELDADVVALQEFGSRNIDVDLRAHLEQATQSRAIVMPTFQKHGSDFGNVILTRLPTRDIVAHQLGVIGREPRNAIETVVDYGSGSLRLIATHLGLRASERNAQIAQLRELLGARTDLPTVLLGDFNEWRKSGSLREFLPYFGPASSAATFPSPYPLAALDRIWVAPARTCIELRAHTSRSARIASDHLPLVVTLELD